MDTHDDVRAVLTSVEPPPSRVDPGVVLRGGERRVRRRRLVAVAASAAAVAAVLAVGTLARGVPRAQQFGVAGDPTVSPQTSTLSSPPARGRTCTAATLPVPSGKARVQAVSVDPTGRYIGGYDIVGQNFVPILWKDNVPQLLQLNATSAYLSAINEHGVGTGIATKGTDEWVFRYENGKFTRLPTPAGYGHPYPTPAINAAGDIVINAEPAGEAGGANSITLIWKAGTTTATKLPLPKQANVSAITDDGHVVGGVYDENSSAVAAFVWDQAGHGRQLSRPEGMVAMAHAARGEWATGGVFDTAETRQPGTLARWNLRTGAVAVLSGGVGGAVNASGWVVSGEGLVTSDSGPVELAYSGPYERAVATGVADNGLVVGYATDRSSGKPQPMTWHC